MHDTTHSHVWHDLSILDLQHFWWCIIGQFPYVLRCSLIWVSSFVYMRHAAHHWCVSCHVPRWYLSIHLYICVMPLVFCHVTRGYVSRHPLICVTSLVDVCQVTSFLSGPKLMHDSFICVPWLIHLCDMPWLIHICDNTICTILEMTRSTCDMTASTCDLTQSLVHDSFICVTWLLHMCDVTHSNVRHHHMRYISHDSFDIWHDSFDMGHD